MSHNPNSQDEMAAEEAAQKYNDEWVSKQTVFYNGETAIRKQHFIPGFLAGCKYKAEQLANPIFIKLDETHEAMVKANAALENMKMFQKDALIYRQQVVELKQENHELRYKARDYDEHLRIINAQAEQLRAAEALIEKLDRHLKHIGMATAPGDNGERTYLMNDDAYIVKQVEKALSAIEKFRKGAK